MLRSINRERVRGFLLTRKGGMRIGDAIYQRAQIRRRMAATIQVNNLPIAHKGKETAVFFHALFHLIGSGNAFQRSPTVLRVNNKGVAVRYFGHIAIIRGGHNISKGWKERGLKKCLDGSQSGFRFNNLFFGVSEDVR